ncbi:MAG: hypothetical protein LAN71_01430 [Acidobacteriia bacterium]|nr:hypothetical protein [Terriglobia bacterium]
MRTRDCSSIGRTCRIFLRHFRLELATFCFLAEVVFQRTGKKKLDPRKAVFAWPIRARRKRLLFCAMLGSILTQETGLALRMRLLLRSVSENIPGSNAFQADREKTGNDYVTFSDIGK